MLLKNGKVFLADQGIFVELDVKFTNEKITRMGRDIEAEEGEDVIDCTGFYVTPGLIDAHSHIGCCEEGIQWEGDDICENEPVTPEMRAIDAINPMDIAFEDAITGGVTTMCTGFGSGGVVAGMQAIIENNGSNVIDKMVVVKDAAIKCAFGENPKEFGKHDKQPNTRASIAFLLRKCLQDAKNYEAQKENAEKEGEPFDIDLGMEAMCRVLTGEIPLKIHAHRADDICTAIRICKEFKLRATLDHCTEGHLIADYIAESGFSAIVGPTYGSRCKYELKNKSFCTPKVLMDAGVRVAIMTDHNILPEESLNWQAAMYMREGLSEADAMRAITCNPADILGISDIKGRIMPGLDADIVIWNRHPLDIQAKPRLVFVKGKKRYENQAAEAVKDVNGDMFTMK